ncbi:MAG: 5-deoxy-glucuronate isomerase [Clostridiales bacterium]|nr:5-deoxy-glucuronate isomerase [Clostridiales bacterium]
MHIRGPEHYPCGYTPITKPDDPVQNPRMDFGVLTLEAGQEYRDDAKLEKAYLLTCGQVTLEWDGESRTIARPNCFDYSPWVLSVPESTAIHVKALEDSEIIVHRTENEKAFVSRLFAPEECASEERGKGTMRETSTRIVRTCFDHGSRPESNLVIGEVIGFPGKWSSFPPHWHRQPEIYYYKFNPKGGHGYAELGDQVVKVSENSTMLITKGETHPQTTYPGYAMWYLWAIRHLPGDPYTAPTFLEAHNWVTKPENEAKIWPQERGSQEA